MGPRHRAVPDDGRRPAEPGSGDRRRRRSLRIRRGHRRLRAAQRARRGLRPHPTHRRSLRPARPHGQDLALLRRRHGGRLRGERPPPRPHGGGDPRGPVDERLAAQCEQTRPGASSPERGPRRVLLRIRRRNLVPERPRGQRVVRRRGRPTAHRPLVGDDPSVHDRRGGQSAADVLQRALGERRLDRVGQRDRRSPLRVPPARVSRDRWPVRRARDRPRRSTRAFALTAQW